jgi:OmpA-OmpF porin, OOP family
MNLFPVLVGWCGLAVVASAQGHLPDPDEYRPTHVNSTYNPPTYVPTRSNRPTDFVPGRRVLVAERFERDTVGSFPARWRTNSVGEIVTLEGIDGHWLTLNQPGHLKPDSIRLLPDEFTLQFDLICTNPFNFYSTGFYTAFASLQNPDADYPRPEQATGCVTLMLHPMDVSGQKGYSELSVSTNRQRHYHREGPIEAFWARDRNTITVSVWRQQQRLRVYVGNEKIWDVPVAFQPALTYNAVIFGIGKTHRDTDSYYLSNLRFSVNK